MKQRAESFVYKLLKKLLNLYNRMWEKEQLRKFAECGVRVSVGPNGRFINDHIHIGNNVFIGEFASFMAAISHIYIGDNVVFGPHVSIRGGDHRTDLPGKYMIDVLPEEKKPSNDADVVIEEDVWVGANVTILKGVTIGKGSVIGAGSIVVKSVPPYTIHVGCPGVKEKPRFSAEEITAHEELINQRKGTDHVQS